MTPDRIGEIRQRLHCACEHLNTVPTMVEKDVPCQDMLHQSNTVDAALQVIGQRLVLYQVDEIEALIKNSSSSEERAAQLQRFVPLYSIAHTCSYLPGDEENHRK
jgi:DNA-binding FrmR family transcriptional regulator